jgi:hypothetical protein
VLQECALRFWCTPRATLSRANPSLVKNFFAVSERPAAVERQMLRRQRLKCAAPPLRVEALMVGLVALARCAAAMLFDKL